MITNDELVKYIQSKANSWSPTTIKSEHARLRNILDLVNKGPADLYAEGIKKWKPYTLKQVFIRVGELYAFAVPNTPNPFKEFLEVNALLFKNVYVKKNVQVSFEEAMQKIKKIENMEIRVLAIFMLFSGVRAEEALTYNGTGEITGKGSKRRKLFILSGIEYPKGHKITYSQLYKALAAVELTPHALRKLYASKLVAGGLKEADLMAIMGWTSMQTASIYVQPKRDEALQKQLEDIFDNKPSESGKEPRKYDQ